MVSIDDVHCCERPHDCASIMSITADVDYTVLIRPQTLVMRPISFWDDVLVPNATMSANHHPLPCGSDARAFQLLKTPWFHSVLVKKVQINAWWQQASVPTGSVETCNNGSVVTFPHLRTPLSMFDGNSSQLLHSHEFLHYVNQWFMTGHNVSAYLVAQGVQIEGNHAWRNAHHVEEMCSRISFRSQAGKTSGLVVSISTYSPQREDVLLELIQHYHRMRFVVQVIVVWHDPSPASLARLRQFEQRLKNTNGMMMGKKEVRLVQQKVRNCEARD